MARLVLARMQVASAHPARGEVSRALYLTRDRPASTYETRGARWGDQRSGDL